MNLDELKRAVPSTMSSNDPSERFNHIFGMPVQKSWYEIFQLEVLLDLAKPKRVLELGTGSGGVSLFLAVHTYMHDCEFYSFDIGSKEREQNISEKTKGFIEGIGGKLITCDIFADDSIILMQRLIKSEGRTILYCDNGDKFKELDYFSSYLKYGDYIITHDYGTELKKEEWEAVIKNNDLIEVAPEWFESYGTLHRMAVKL